MLRWLHSVYSQRSNDDFVTYVAGIIDWFYLLRMGEYATPDKQGWRYDRVLTGMDVLPRVQGSEITSFAEADEAVVYIKGSKTD